MLIFDITKTSRQGHHSGLTRVSERLRQEFGDRALAARWETLAWKQLQSEHTFLSAELFCEAERPGFWDFLRNRSCRCEALFHDAIPLRHPSITWPQSVARHPEYMKMLASFDRIWAISDASRQDLLGFWRWQGVAAPPPVEVLALGADAEGTPRVDTQAAKPAGPPLLLCVGILEPRKNQDFLLDVCCDLWERGMPFELHLIGRVNPHFGKPLLKRVQSLCRRLPQLHFHEAADDAVISALYARACATVFPTIAEGCGLPLLESLWHGLPCLCSDLPVLRENADGGGCLALRANDREAWKAGIASLIDEHGPWLRLADEARSRTLPTWRACAERLLSACG